MNNPIEIYRVKNWLDRRRFITFAWRVYKHDPLWVPPLVPERMKLLNPKTSQFLTHSRADFFIAYKNGRPAGTIMAANDVSSNRLRKIKECMIGFFECIDDQAVANALFNAAMVWGRDHNLERLVGPFNMDYDSAYGLLIQGRDLPPVVNCGHTPVYYQKMFESYGFTPLRPDNLAFALNLREETDQIRLLHRLANKAREKGTITLREGRLEEWDKEADRIHKLLNQSLAHLPGFVGWDREALNDSLEPFRKYADPYLILFTDVDGESVGFFPGIPNLNEVLSKINGLRYPWDYLNYLRYRKLQPKCLAIKSVLVLPEHWGSGASLILFDEMWKRARERGYEWIDLSLTSDDNPKTPMLATRMGAVEYKRYRVYQLPL
jgi:GNAT superfamily N-acetyltransferase